MAVCLNFDEKCGLCWFQYKATDYVVKEPGKLELVFTPTGGKEHRMEVFTFKDRGGVGMSMYNTDEVNQHIVLNSAFVPFLHISTMYMPRQFCLFICQIS